MQIICQSYRRFRLGGTLTNLVRNTDIRGVRFKHTRGPLPWECKDKFADKPQKKFRKAEVETVVEKECPDKCAVLQKPKRNTYEWVVDDDAKPCKPFKIKAVIEKSVCEMRRFKECLHKCGDPALCQNLVPDCSKINKIYPMMEAIEKGSIPGCARPLETKKQAS